MRNRNICFNFEQFARSMTDQRKITTDPYALQDPSASSLSQRSTSPAVDDQSKRELRPSHVGRWITQFAQGEPSAQDIDIDPRTEAPKQEIPLEHLLKNNVKWAKRMTTIDPEFFTRLAQQQRPQILWIGCSDSRVPANQIIDLAPGEIFVHRNLANVIYHCDFNSHSVIQYAVDVLKVQHVIVCGHYGCGAIAASAVSKQMGIIDNWVRNIRDVYSKHFDQLQQCKASNPNGPDSPEAHQVILSL
jgi:carbonic anhydrase